MCTGVKIGDNEETFVGDGITDLFDGKGLRVGSVDGAKYCVVDNDKRDYAEVFYFDHNGQMIPIGAPIKRGATGGEENLITARYLGPTRLDI